MTDSKKDDAADDAAAEGLMHVTRESRLFLVLAAIIITSALVAELIAVKLFEVSVYGWIGISKVFVLTAGSLVWPVVFLTTDTINEFFGKRAVKFVSWLTSAMVALMFCIVQIAIAVRAAPWCNVRLNADQSFAINNVAQTTIENGKAVPIVPMDIPFSNVFGQSIWIMIGSLAAFMLSQLVDVSVFHLIRRALKGRFIWARATGSTIVSQLIDSFVVIYIAFWLPGYVPGANPSQAYTAARCLEISRDSFIYKVGFAIALTPVIYLGHWLVHRWLGHEKAQRLAQHAAENS